MRLTPRALRNLAGHRRAVHFPPAGPTPWTPFDQFTEPHAAPLRSFTMLLIAATLVAGLAFSRSAFAQSPSTQPASVLAPSLAFDLADVHPSAHSKAAYMSGAPPHGGRFHVHNATIVDLVSIAYGFEDTDKILGGPSWLDIDRYDVAAKAPPTTSDDDMKLMLRNLLADRFKLVLHNDTKPMPAFVMTVDKGGPRMKQSDGSGELGCKTLPQPTAPPSASPVGAFSCHGESMEAFA
ncbi:MAG TPA: TIGR03435 family protein, partial [Acidobacteriaceae bacterium]|nr:TIGR03435 family protein [Acidobacteriaceae bacterium]